MNATSDPPASQTSSYNSQTSVDYQGNPVATAAAALSQHHAPTPNGNGRKRKATSAPGSRGVANLTPDQLTKKRANDREAQRAIRERTRNTIESLVTRIKELESQQPFQELQKVAQERDNALQQCEDLKAKLATVASVVGGNSQQQGQQQQPQQQQQQPDLHGTFDAFDEFIHPTWLTASDAELAALTAQQSPLPTLGSRSHTPQQYSQSPSTGPAYEQQQHHIHPDLRSPHTASQSSPVDRTSSAEQQHQADLASVRRWTSSNEQSHNSHFAPTNGYPYDQRLPPPAQMLSQNSGERQGLDFILEPKQQVAKTSQSTPPQLPPYVPPSAPEPPVYTRLPNNSAPSSPLDYLLLDFLANRHQQQAAGMSIKEVAGPEYPSFSAVYEPNDAASKACHPVSALLIDILSKFPDISAIPEKVAVLHIMFLVLRWQICPCETCYNQMPDWIKPTKEQIDTPHPAWLDHIPWPIIRQRLIATDHVEFENFFIPFTSKLCLNWPYPKDQVLITSPSANADDRSALRMNPVFESHLSDLSNWSLGTDFKDTFPDLVDEGVRIQDEQPHLPG